MITGTLINYYVHCKRQCWLHGNKINLEDNSELVKIGKQQHKSLEQKYKRTELSIEGIKIDRITDDYIVEYKKSDADLEAVKWQVFYYLKVLKDRGVERKGKIILSEKNKTSNKVHLIELTQEKELEIERLAQEAEEFVYEGQIPKPVFKKSCKKCAYFTYCKI